MRDFLRDWVWWSLLLKTRIFCVRDFSTLQMLFCSFGHGIGTIASRILLGEVWRTVVPVAVVRMRFFTGKELNRRCKYSFVTSAFFFSIFPIR